MILVLGARGMLGWDIIRLLSYGNIPHIAVDRDDLDICNELQLHRVLKTFKINYVINCAAFTDVAKAETMPTLARKINADAVLTLSQACEKNKAGLLHFSTDFVFDGTSTTPRREVDKAFPLNVYGQTKYEGELNILNTNTNFKILRLQWLYGKNGGGFIGKMLMAFAKNGKLEVIDDQFGSPCSAEFISNMILHVISNWEKIPTGIYHVTHDDYCSWYDYAKFAFERLEIRCNIDPISYKQFKANVVRPNYGLLDCTKIKQALGMSSLGDWRSDLDLFFKQYRNLIINEIQHQNK